MLDSASRTCTLTATGVPSTMIDETRPRAGSRRIASFGVRNEERQTFSDPCSGEILLHEMSRVLLHVRRNRGDCARHHASRTPLQHRIRSRGSEVYQKEAGRRIAHAAPSEG